MDVALFDYNLPAELIAQRPAAKRSASRMLVLERAMRRWTHRRFCDLPEYIQPGDCVVLNDTRVIPARLVGRLPTGGRVEILLLRPLGGDRWEALGQPGRRLRPGTCVTFGGLLTVRVVGVGEAGVREVELEYEGDLREVLECVGLTPLPPYIKREKVPDVEQEQYDRERYQTVYARREGAVAAPTAGLHFDRDMLTAVRAAGAQIAYITLHVGAGTFRPVKVQRVEEHKMHAEWYEVSPQAAQLINQARRVIAVGTTVVRALETRASAEGTVTAGTGWSELFIYPGYQFKVVDCLLMMVSAFAGRELILAAYQEAIKQRYRFYSYGDCMLIL